MKWKAFFPLIFAAFCALACFPAAAADTQASIPQVLIRIKLTRTGKDGKQAVICEPNLVALLGHPAHFQAEGPPAAPADTPLGFRLGTTADAIVLKVEGNRFYARAKASVVESAKVNPDGASIATTGLEFFGAITAGKAVVVSAPSGQGEKMEIVVEKVGPVGKPPAMSAAKGAENRRSPSADRPASARYEIRLEVTEHTPDGTETKLFEHSAAAVVGKPISFWEGQDVESSMKPRDPLRSGAALNAELLCKDGELFLDATASLAYPLILPWPDSAAFYPLEENGDAFVATSSQRVVKRLTLGRPSKFYVRCPIPFINIDNDKLCLIYAITVTRSDNPTSAASRF